MEEPRAPQATPEVSNAPSSGQTLPPQPPLPPSPLPPNSLPPPSKKRPLECDAHMQKSNYFKIRAVIKDLRPHFLEVLQTPDFRNCKASDEIREQLKILVDLYKHMKADVDLQGSSKIVQEQPQHVKTQEQSQIDSVWKAM